MTEQQIPSTNSQRADEPAKRYDAGKPRVDLIPPDFIVALGEHFGRGAVKYSERNWEKGMLWSRCVGPALRHLLAWMGGERDDPDTGTHHLIAAAWNLCALWWYETHGVGTDDRYKPAAATVNVQPAICVMGAAPGARCSFVIPECSRCEREGLTTVKPDA